MPLQLPIYLDSHATTPCDPRVVEAMLPCFTKKFGNAASRNHPFGWEAEALVENAREQIAKLINCNPREIVFTSGATESDNLAIKGVAHFRKFEGQTRASQPGVAVPHSPSADQFPNFHAPNGKHIITSVIEHKAVLDTCKRLEKEGFRVTYLPVGKDGRVQSADVEKVLCADTILVSVMFANNEIGTIQPIAEIGALCKRKGVFFHCDAVQALAYLPCDVQALGIDLLSISGHKMYGPKGVGALYVRRRDPRIRLEPMMDGGGHERGIRSGTLNVPGIVGLGKAAEIVLQEREQDAERIKQLRDRLLQKITTALPDTVINGSMEHRLPNNLNVSFPGVDGEALLSGMSGVAVSSGSACMSATLEPSYVLAALGASEAVAHSSIRFGLHRFTTEEDIDYTAELCVRTVQRLRKESPMLVRVGDTDQGDCRTAKAINRGESDRRGEPS